MEQINLFSTEKSTKERDAYEKMLPDLLSVMDAENLPCRWISFNEGTSYSSVSIKNKTLLRMRFGKKTNYISFPYRCIKDLSIPNAQQKDDGFIVIKLDSPGDISAYFSVAVHALHVVLETIRPDFDCCNSFYECSDAMRCVHPDKYFAAGCGYRRILKSGRVFFGKNRNVDTPDKE